MYFVELEGDALEGGRIIDDGLTPSPEEDGGLAYCSSSRKHLDRVSE